MPTKDEQIGITANQVEQLEELALSISFDTLSTILLLFITAVLRATIQGLSPTDIHILVDKILALGLVIPPGVTKH